MSFVVKLALYANYISHAQTRSVMVISGIKKHLFDGILLSKQIYFLWISIFLQHYKVPIWHQFRRGGGGGGGGMGGPLMARRMNSPVKGMAGNRPPSPSKLKPVKKVRKLFPETWLWKNIMSG